MAAAQRRLVDQSPMIRGSHDGISTAPVSCLVSGAMLGIYGPRCRIVVSGFWEARTLTPAKWVVGS